ncbi:stage II sporulation protein M [Clostridium estertheticum]|uniref:Stage II sporulation protein M n=2 Tax=Clostridium estertheticum TaxID=238834 RepID=A0A1J0GJA5_9CLOT|nr:stage II sporulation protein M [Clostridium estertheticum]APC40998.1 stage II sporulation protein M [Clostridium estertheticum subsp. estertheticum]MBU3074064.1 stage II sporulation protein M [Clostridium estertheticum]MBU3164158.1 stage II sporulation protein M [Clostridium estertheticum]MBU3170094.1 stage II sporulation protein M [Clostridium estertheticum]MBZ9617131.1 stage II sporulation protein M [Clostridium estertheticum subsp. laramiense]
MSSNTLVSNVNKHIQENYWLYIISILCVFTGIILGIYSVKYMGEFEHKDLVNYLVNFIDPSNTSGISYKLIFFQSIKNNLPVIIFLWFLGLTIVGLPIIVIIDLLKGFTVGFTFSFMISGLGKSGIGIAMLGVLPQNLIYIPCTIFASVISMEFSIMLLRNKFNKQWTSSISSRIIYYSVIFIVIIAFLFIGIIIESYIAPYFVKNLINNLGSLSK